MKVERSESGSGDKTRTGGSKKAKGGKGHGPGETVSARPVEASGFVNELKAVRDESLSEGLNALLEELDDRGEQLKRRPTFDELVNYKHAVRKFLSYIINNGYEVQEKIGGSLRRQKVYLITKKIDQSLEDLAALVMSKQADKIKIAAKIDEIRGMLFDFTG